MTILKTKLNKTQLVTFLAHCLNYNLEEHDQEFKSISHEIFKSELNEEINFPTLEEIQEDYTRLFINNIPKTLAPPYEGYYRENQEDTLQKLNLFYAQEGYESGNERADHIVSELQFYALLKHSNKTDLALEFFNEHLNKWIFSFADKIMINTKTKYFQLIGKITIQIFEQIRREKKS